MIRRYDFQRQAFVEAGVTALGRAGGSDDITGAVAALLGSGSRRINGQRSEASGGMML